MGTVMYSQHIYDPTESGLTGLPQRIHVIDFDLAILLGSH